MKKILVCCILFCCCKAAFCQTDASYSDPDFLKAYASIAFMPGKEGVPMIRKWDHDLKLFIEGKQEAGFRKRVTAILDKVNPLLNGLKIELTNEKGQANCVLKTDTVSKTHFELAYDERGNLYKGRLFLNTENVFNDTEQDGYIAAYLMNILGDFHLPVKITPELARRLRIDPDLSGSDQVQTILKDKLHGFSDFDLKVIRFHYSTDLKAGTTKKEFQELVKTMNHTR